MALSSGIYKQYRRLFALNDDGLRRIEGVLKKAASTYSEPLSVTFHVRREDDRFYETVSVDEVLSDANVPDRRVKLLGLELRKTATLEDVKEKEQDQVAWIVFDKDRPPLPDPDVRVRISSPDKTWALLLADELEPQISRLFKVKKFPKRILLLLAPVLALMGFRASSWAGFPLARNYIHALLAAALFGLLVLALTFYTAIAEKKFGWLEILRSESVFLWGEEVSNAADRESVRKNIFWVVIVGFLVSLVAGLVPLLI